MGTNYYLKRIPTEDEYKQMKDRLEKMKIYKIYEEDFFYDGDEPETLQGCINKYSKIIHIGKSSCGWRFLFKQNPEYERTMDAVFEYLRKVVEGDNPQYEFYNEYDEKVTVDEFIELVKSKMDGMDCFSYYDKYPEHRSYYSSSHQDYIAPDNSRWTNDEFS